MNKRLSDSQLCRLRYNQHRSNDYLNNNYSTMAMYKDMLEKELTTLKSDGFDISRFEEL